MRTKLVMMVIALLSAMVCPDAVEAFPGPGGGPPRGAGPPGGGGPRVGGGGAPRLAPRAMSAPRPYFSASRPPASFHNPPAQLGRPQPSQFYRPSGGLKPTAGPYAQRPSGGTRPNISSPSLARARPAGLPGSGTIDRPGGIGGYRPEMAARGRPGAGPSARPGLGAHPGAGSRIRPGGDRPGAGQLGDFLGMAQPIQRPGGELAARPHRPGIGERPGQPGRIENGRPGLDNRPGRHAALGQRTNRVLNERPTWSNITADRITGINDHWHTAINRAGAARNRPVGGRWDRWGDGIRDHWRDFTRGYANGWFDRGWWDRHDSGACGWHYSYSDDYDRYDYSYWWTTSDWAYATRWLSWSSDSSTSSQPVYYDYDTGGNVTYQDNRVYIYGEQVASADEFAESAAALATVAPPANEEEAERTEWMPLGTFAFSASEKDTQPSRVIQLAVNKQGVIAGTLYNTQMEQAAAVQGQVDKATQRVAFRIGEDENTVFETGLYNLMQDEVPVLVHFGKDKVENYLLVRMELPKEVGAAKRPE